MGHIRSALAAFAFILLLPATLPLSAAVIRVPAEQPTIQAGIDAAVDGDTVLVSPGTYTGDGNRDMSFGGKAITVRSEYGYENCWIDCDATPTNRHRAFEFNSGEGPDSILDGFSITGGVVYTTFTEGGGALRIEDASPTIRNNDFISNRTFNDAAGGGGGAIGVQAGEALVVNCILWDNWWHGNRNQLLVGYDTDATVTIHHCCIQGGEDEVEILGGTLIWGEGMIDTDPLFATGPSADFPSHIRGWKVDGRSVSPLDGCSFFAWSPVLPRFGARLASGTDLDGDGRHEIVVGAGPDPSIGSPVRVFDYQEGAVTQDFSLQAYLSGWTHGVTVATGSFE